MTVKVVYAFCETAFCSETEKEIKRIAALCKKHDVEPLIAVDTLGRTARALKHARLPYDLVSTGLIVQPQDFFFKALFLLATGTMAVFRYMRAKKPDIVHCVDTDAMMLWGNAARMYRTPLIVNVDPSRKYAKLARMILTDAALLICPQGTDVKMFPYSARPKVSFRPDEEEYLPFLSERYNLITKKESHSGFVGFLNK